MLLTYFCHRYPLTGDNADAHKHLSFNKLWLSIYWNLGLNNPESSLVHKPWDHTTFRGNGTPLQSVLQAATVVKMTNIIALC